MDMPDSKIEWNTTNDSSRTGIDELFELRSTTTAYLVQIVSVSYVTDSATFTSQAMSSFAWSDETVKSMQVQIRPQYRTNTQHDLW